MRNIARISIVSILVFAGVLNLYAASEIDKNIRSEIEVLLRTRDETIQKKDSESFKKTQTSDAIGTAVDGYMKYEKLKSELVALRPYNDSASDKLVGFVKETFYKNGKAWKSAYCMQIYRKINDKWLVEKIVFEN